MNQSCRGDLREREGFLLGGGRRKHRYLLSWATPLILTALPGCFGTSQNGLPATVTVVLPDGSEAPATLGSGVIILADTTWDFFRLASNAQGAAFVRVKFGPNGELSSFENNTFARQIFGDTILFDGARHNTAQTGVQYAAATYGASTSDDTGFTFAGRLTAWAFGLEAANATATASAVFDESDPNVVQGTFTFKSEVTLADIPEGNLDEEYPFMGRRVTEE